jgi:Flp pilus assembly protein TadD
MSTKSRALIAAFLISAVAAPTVATAQQKPAAGAPAKPTISKEAQPALVALEKAVKENRTAEIPALGAAAVAASKTNTDRYFAYRLQLPTLAKANNDAALLTAIEGVLATGIATGPELANLSLLSAKLNFNKGASDTAATTLAATRIQQAVQLTPNDGEAHYILGLIQNRQKRPAEAVASIQKAQQLFAAAGKPYDANIADQLFGIAYTAKLPVARDLALAQVKATPSPKTWRAAVKMTEQSSNFTSADKVDLFRLQRATNSLEGEGDYYPYVDALMTRGLPGEAKVVLEEAFAAGKLDKSKPMWRDTYNSAVTRNAADKSAPNGDVHLGRGEYAKAAAAYRADAAKGGAGADLANLRLGIALARSGDKAGATAALNAVKGQRASIAQMWLVYLQSAA